MQHEFIFGIFNAGRPVFFIGNPAFCTTAQAEFIAELIKPQINDILLPGDYLAYDYAASHNMGKNVKR